MDTLGSIRQQVFSLRPVLGGIYKEFGQNKLKDYVQNNWQLPKAQPDAVFLSVLLSEAQKFYGPRISQTAVSQLKSKPLVSTIDHHGLWGHPFFVNSDLIYSLYFKAHEYGVVLATESVSLNNTSSWSGSLLAHGPALSLQRHSFFPDRVKTLPVFSTPAITADNIGRFKKNTRGKFNAFVDLMALEKKGDNFSAQAALASSRLWQAVFPPAPELLYLPLESLVIKYLLRVFEDPDNIFSRLILTAAGRSLWQKYFGNEHTFLFWGINSKGRREILESVPGELAKLMRERKIYPSSPLCFAVLLYAGLSCVGGFTQTTWLTETKEKFLKLLSEMPEAENIQIKNIKAVPTKNFAESSLAWLKAGSGYFMPTAADLYLAGKDYYPKYLNLAESLTLGQSLDLAMPLIYAVVAGGSGKNNNDVEAEGFQRQVIESLNMGLLVDSLPVI